MPFRTRSLIVALAGMAAACAAHGEVIILKNGRELQGKATRVGDNLRIEFKPGAAVIIRSSEVAEIRPGSWHDEYLRRRAGLARSDAAANYRLALWCKSRGLQDNYEAQLARVVATAPRHNDAAKRLRDLRRARQQARKKPAPTGTTAPRQPSADGVRRFSTAHVRAISDGTPGATKRVAETGERVTREVARLLEVDSKSPRLASFRVIVRYYRTREDYMKVARSSGVTGNAGFYSARSATCHVVGLPDGKLGDATLRTVRHEVTHAFLWRVMQISSADPWLHEGLACLMESQRDDRLSKSRLWALAANPAKAQLSVPALYSSKFKTGTIGERLINYGRAWSFAHFMVSSGDSDRFKAYMKVLRDSRGWKADPRKALEKHFPDRAALEASWRAHVNDLITRHMPRGRRSAIPAPDSSFEEYRRAVLSPRRSLPWQVDSRP